MGAPGEGMPDEAALAARVQHCLQLALCTC